MVRELHVFHPMDGLLRDVRYSLRLLRKSPLFATMAVVVIGLGLGANTLIFSVINGVLLNHLPYRDAGQVVMIWWNASRSGRAVILGILTMTWEHGAVAGSP